jgi:CubicO group peptidase (beta-lactamase class C family)
VTEIHGDRDLAAQVGERLGERHPVFAAATVVSGETRMAAVGAELTADFEIGSISKGCTGLLYADALRRGEVEPATTLGELLPLGDVAAAGVTLASVSTHHSGLPRLPPASAALRKTVALWLHGRNPYGESLDELIVKTRPVRLGKPRGRYSNLGFELLGHAIARAASTTFADLLEERIAKPLDIACYAPANPGALRPGAVTGRSKPGRPQEPWTGEAVGPAGGIRASIEDLAKLTAALLDGSAPGMAALDPVTNFGGPAVRIGAAWITVSRKDRQITWHNGGTGGFRSWLGIDRAAGTGAVVLSATSVSVDRVGFDLLDRI